MIVVSQPNKVITSCQIANIILATKFKWKIKHTDQSKYRIKQWTGYEMIIVSQPYKEITSCQTANIILATKIQIISNNIYI